MSAVTSSRRWRDWWPTVLAAVLSTATVALLIIAFARVSSYERQVVTAALSSSVLWISAALIGSCSTIAALTLSTIGLLGLLEIRRMSPRILMHVRLTVYGSVVTIALAVAALILTTFPVAGEVDDAPLAWQINVAFYGLLVLTALMIGAFAIVLTSLATTVTDVMRTLPQDWVEDILHDHDTDAPRDEHE